MTSDSGNDAKAASDAAALDARIAAEFLAQARKDCRLTADGLLIGLSGAEIRLFMDGYIKRARAHMAGKPDPLLPDDRLTLGRLTIKHMKAVDVANGK